MLKFYRELPEEIIDILSISNGWLIGSSIEKIIDKKDITDYDIIVPKDNYRTIFRYINRYKPIFNNHGGIKVTTEKFSIDIWIDSLETYLLSVGGNFTYAYNFNKNLLISNVKET